MKIGYNNDIKKFVGHQKKAKEKKQTKKQDRADRFQRNREYIEELDAKRE
jgi:hypothetical protein